MASLEDLPEEMVIEICQYLTLEDLLMMLETSTFFRDVAAGFINLRMNAEETNHLTVCQSTLHYC